MSFAICPHHQDVPAISVLKNQSKTFNCLLLILVLMVLIVMDRGDGSGQNSLLGALTSLVSPPAMLPFRPIPSSSLPARSDQL